jgi:hypothetical protein
MERGKVPPNWEDLARLSHKSATDKSVNLALKWLSGQELDVNKDGDLVPVQDWISNPFSIVPDQHGAVANNLRTDITTDIGATLNAASEGECERPPLIEPFGKAAPASPHHYPHKQRGWASRSI